MNLLRQNLSKTDYLKYFSHTSDIAGIKMYEYKGGKQEGVKGIDVKTGTGFAFTVIPDRGMDILNTDYCGIPVSWVSKTESCTPRILKMEALVFLEVLAVD